MDDYKWKLSAIENLQTREKWIDNSQDHQAPAVILLRNNAPSGALVHPMVIG